MKKIVKFSLAVAALSFATLFTSCEKEKVKVDPVEEEGEQIIFDGNVIGNGSQEFESRVHTQSKKENTCSKVGFM